MKIGDQITNPYLPEYEYVPDGEPHVFGDRVYIFGSHDRFGGKKFCMNDYVCYSADVHDLTDWRYEGVIYGRTQDPRMADGKHELWAPDVARGKDGRYYLYYCPDDSIKSIGVAVCDEPAGRYEFLGIVHDRYGRNIGERAGDTIQFDPGVFIDDDGKIWLYSGNGPCTKWAVGREHKASVVMELMDDMVTIRTEPRRLLPTLGGSEGTGFEGHEFFEASSIRKTGGKYYLVYSSVNLHEMCYAVSDRPDRGFRYGGVIVSNCDSFVEPHSLVRLETGNALADTRRAAHLPPFTPEKKNCIGNDHGGIEQIDGQWYIFYHRQTNGTMFSRQGCAERITILPDGSIPQVELTSQGLNGKPLEGRGVYPAAMAAELYGKHAPVIAFSPIIQWQHPLITQDGPDTDPEAEGTKPRQYIRGGRDGMTAVYRYFDAQGVRSVGVKTRGSARGQILVRTEEGGTPVGAISVQPSKEWTWSDSMVAIPDGVCELRLTFTGRGVLEVIEIRLQ